MTGRRMTRVAMAYQRRPVATSAAGSFAEAEGRTAIRSAEHGEDRRQDEEGEGAGGQHDDGAGNTHRVDEALGKDGQGGEGGGDGQ